MNLRKSGKVFGKIHHGLLEFAAEQTGDAVSAKTLRAHCGIEGVGAKMGFGIDATDRLGEFQREPRGRMHRNVKRGEPGFPESRLLQRLARKGAGGEPGSTGF